MKQINKVLAMALLSVSLGASAQNADQPWSVTVGMNALDGARFSASPKVEEHFAKFFKTDSWSILPAVSSVEVSRHVVAGLSFGVSGSVNKMQKFVDRVDGSDDTMIVSTDLMYYGLDGYFRYNFGSLKGWFDPNVFIGGGYTFLGENSAPHIGGGVGLNLWVADNIGITLQSAYKHQMDDERRPSLGGIPSHIQHTAGVIFRFGGKDTDGDGILDKYDECVDLPGLPEYNGCPDTDKDTVIDPEDECPYIPGLVELKGCPDSDGDGVPDHQDACPDVPGLIEFDGCPDTDGDGVRDEEDECPEVKGPKENNGCPWPDTDGDGVLDKDDECPEVKGSRSNSGCPEVKKEDIDQLNAYGKTILFNVGKSSFQDATYAVLDEMVKVMKRFPNAKFAIEGHTDSTGSDKINEPLSKDRATAVMNYLISKGISSSRLSAEGYGSSRPIDTNATAEGRAHNRRTEVRLVK